MTDEQVKMFDLLKESNTNLRLMLEDTFSIPIIGITAKAYKESIALCIKAGMQKVLTRPFEHEELLAVIFRTLKYALHRTMLSLLGGDNRTQIYATIGQRLQICFSTSVEYKFLNLLSKRL